MRKFLLTLLVPMIFIPIYSYTIVFGTTQGSPLYKVINQEEIHVSETNQSVKRMLGNFIILPEHEEIDKEEVKKMVKRISNIHPSIIQYLVKENAKIMLFHESLTDLHHFQHLKGQRPKGWSEGSTWEKVPGGSTSSFAAAKIGASEFGEGHGNINLELHEIGHLFERNYGMIRSDKQFREFWEEESPKLFAGREYFNTYPEEYFAEAFAMYYLEEQTRELLKEKAPNTYEFIQSLETPRVTYLNIDPHI